MYFFSDYKKVCKAEWLKLKGSGMFWLTLIMAAFIPAIFTIVGLFVTESAIPDVNSNPWKDIIRNCFGGFGGFFFPIFLSLVVIRLTQMEHRGGGWKLIETQPISKSSLYLGKFSMSVVVAFLCITALVIFSLLSGLIIMLVKSGSGYSKSPIPFTFILGLSFRLLISGLGILGIQYLFSVVISGFLGPFGIGLAATITGSILLGLGKVPWWPYSAPGLTITNVEGSATGKFLLHYEWLSIAWMILALWLGYQWYQQKNIKRAFFKSIPRFATLVVPVILFAGYFMYINKPVQLSSYGKTIIAGRFDTKESITKAYLLVEPMLDTVLEIPVEKNAFHFQTDKKIPAAVYYLKAGTLQPAEIFFSNNDSIYIKLEFDGRNGKITTGGNRLPENEYIKQTKNNAGYQTYYLENFGYEMKPKAFAAQLLQQWRSETEKIGEFKTVDNLKPADDFIALQKKLVSLRYLKILDLKYAKSYRVYHPNDSLILPPSINEIRNAADFNDSSLLVYEQYREILTDYYQQSLKLSLSNDTAYISKLTNNMHPGKVRDYLLYNKIKEAIGRIRDSVKREDLISNYVPLISETKTRQKLIAQHDLLKSLHRGKMAPDFKTTALNRDTFSLENFKGRYVVIDVWATWCAPCKIQSPNFERLAEQFTSPEVAFVALSIDDNIWNWRNEANEKSSRVLQLIANDKNSFGRSFGIETIPRFMLLGPDGRIINVQMPYPSEPEFEDILKNEIPGLAIL